MECALYHFKLLLAAETAEVHSVTRYPYGKGWILFRMLHSVDKNLSVHDVNIEVMSALNKISVKYGHKIVDTVFWGLAQGVWYDRERIGNTVLANRSVRYLRNRVE